MQVFIRSATDFDLAKQQYTGSNFGAAQNKNATSFYLMQQAKMEPSFVVYFWQQRL